VCRSQLRTEQRCEGQDGARAEGRIYTSPRQLALCGWRGEATVTVGVVEDLKTSEAEVRGVGRGFEWSIAADHTP
jgi:hypothetical protein